MLLTVPQCTGWLPTSKKDPVQDVRSAKAEKPPSNTRKQLEHHLSLFSEKHRNTAGNMLTMVGLYPAGFPPGETSDADHCNAGQALFSLKPKGHEEKRLPPVEMPLDLPKHVHHILELGTGTEAVMAQAAKVWPNILSVSGQRLVYTSGGHVCLLDKLKDYGLNIFIFLSKSGGAPPIRNGCRPLFPEMCSMLH